MKKILVCLIPTLLLLCLLASCAPSPAGGVSAEPSGDSSAEVFSSAEPWESSGEASSAPEQSRPEETEPEVSEPEVSEPEASKPEVSEPEVSEPEVSEPEASEPEVSEPEVSEPEASEPEASEPETSEPEISEPEISEPETSEPEISEPEISEPEASEPEVSEPEASEPEEIYVEKIVVSAPKGELTVGETMTLDVQVSPDNADEKGVTWSISSGSQYASISADGVLTAKTAGKVTVKATAKDGSGVSATYTVTVKPILVTSITISGNTTVEEGKTITLSAAVKPSNASNKEVTWSISSGSQYASISASGVLTAKAAGKVTVKATAKDGSGVSATYTVTVKAGAMWEGEGTKSNPFLIKNLTDLKNLQKVVDKKGYYFLQVADIDCSSVETWIVIGDWDNPFRHHYDGGGYTISNICYDGEAQSLFSRVEGSHFKNMNIVNAHTKDNHRTEENRTDKQPGDGSSTGAIVGYGSGCSFENCTAVVNFQSSNSTTGGLIGAVELKNEKYVLMKNCHVSGIITSGGYTGGLIGNISKYLSDGDYSPAETITIENCSADVEIIIFTSSMESCVGGLIGESFGVKIEKCHATGSINVIDGDIGGLVGNAGNYTDIIRCYASVDIYASSDDHYGGVSIGGLIGHIYSRSDVIDCYATGNISAPYVEWSPCQDSTNVNGGPWRRYYNPCGSLIGCLEVFKAYSEDQKITVYNCYATGIVDVPNICEDKRVYCHGALIGLVLDRNTVTRYNVKDTSKDELTSWDDFKEHYNGHFGDNYNLEDLRTYYSPINDYEYRNISGLQNPKYDSVPQHEYVKIITEEQLTDQSVFEGWDFENVWKMGENGPELR